MFEIFLNKPRIDKKTSLKDCESIGELIENIFPLSEDYFYINWNRITIFISYKYDLSIIFEDYVYIFKFLESSNEDKLKITFPSNTFDVIWDIRKDRDNINILSQWNTVLSHNEKKLNESSFLEVNADIFRKELSKLLRFIYNLIIYEANNINTFLLNDILKNKPSSLIL